MRLLVNIGNTHAVFAVYDPAADQITPLKRVLTALLTVKDIPRGYDSITVASVVPERNKLFPPGTFFLNAEQPLPFAISAHINRSGIGADRLANLIAGCENGVFPVLCIDAGTCITFEYIDEHGVFSSGLIIPGRALQRKALHLHTAQLPDVPLVRGCQPPQIAALTNTVNVMIYGIDVTLHEGVRAHLKTWSRLSTKPMQTFLTGGDAAFFADLKDDVPLQIAPDLTLRGLSLCNR